MQPSSAKQLSCRKARQYFLSSLNLRHQTLSFTCKTVTIRYISKLDLKKRKTNKQQLTLSICGGQLLPVASTGMSSYFSKLMPVLLPENSSLKTEEKVFHLVRRINPPCHVNLHCSITYCSKRSLGGRGFDQSSSSDLSHQRLFPPRSNLPKPLLS